MAPQMERGPSQRLPECLRTWPISSARQRPPQIPLRPYLVGEFPSRTASNDSVSESTGIPHTGVKLLIGLRSCLRTLFSSESDQPRVRVNVRGSHLSRLRRPGSGEVERGTVHRKRSMRSLQRHWSPSAYRPVPEFLGNRCVPDLQGRRRAALPATGPRRRN